RIAEGRIECYVNEHLVVTSMDRQLTQGRVGVAKFRDTEPEFRRFTVGPDLAVPPMAPELADWLAELGSKEAPLAEIDQMQVDRLAQSDRLAQADDAAARALLKQAIELDAKAKQMRNLAGDVLRAPLL